MKIINQSEVESLIKGTKGKLFSVQFTKVDGNERNMLCRLGVKPKTSTKTGTKRNTSSKYIVVYDMKLKEYRNVNPQTVSVLKANKETYIVK